MESCFVDWIGNGDANLSGCGMLRFPGNAQVDTSQSGMADVQEKMSRSLNNMLSRSIRTEQCLQLTGAPQAVWGSVPLSGRESSALLGSEVGALVLSTKSSHRPFPLFLPNQGKCKDMLRKILPRKQQMGDFCLLKR